MLKAFGVFWSSLRVFYGELFPMAGMTLIWFVLSLPVGALMLSIFIAVGTVVPGLAFLADTVFAGPLVFYLLLLLLIIGPNPVSAGIHYYANQAVREQLLDFGYFWTGLRRYFVRSIILFGITFFGLIVLLFNLSFYLSSSDGALRILGLVFLYFLYFWLSTQIYLLPILIEQEHRSLWGIIKSAVLVAMDNPGFTLVLFVLMLIWTAACMLLTPLAPLAAGAVAAIVANKALLNRFEKYGLYKPPSELP